MAKGQIKQKLTEETIAKLEHAFSIDATVDEACFYADISRETYYRWIKENEELYDKFERLRAKPVLAARNTVIESLKDPKDAQWYLERKRKHEFSQKTEVEVSDKRLKLDV